jgi:uncharacterized protein (TIGR02147 family)
VLSAATPSPAAFLRSVLAARIEKNPRYSARAFARDLGVSQTFISFVLSGKKPLSIERATRISQILGLEQEEGRRFLKAVVLASPSRRGAYGALRAELARAESQAGKNDFQIFEIEQDHFRVISDWYHFAILDILTCRGARSSARWIAERLGLPLPVVQAAIERLFRVGLLIQKGGRWVKTKQNIVARTNGPDSPVHEFHRQMIQKALENVATRKDASDVAARDVASLTLSADPETLPKIREEITRFQKRVIRLMQQGPCTEVYQFNIQLLPLTGRKAQGEVQ